MLKKLIFFINLFFFSSITVLSFAEIIPLKKPIQTKEQKDQKLLIDVMKPLPKPIPKKIVEKKKKNPLSPQVIGNSVAVHAADIPVIAGITSIGASNRSLS